MGSMAGRPASQSGGSQAPHGLPRCLQGDVLGMQRHGHGTLTCSNGATYEGGGSHAGWEELHAAGLLLMQHTPPPPPTLPAGGWRLDLRHGRGKFQGEDGIRYEGGWQHGKTHG